jgi:ketosteroid isomerase-like protein
MPDTNKEVVRRLLGAFETLDITAMDALLAPDAVWEIPGDPAQFPLAGELPRDVLLCNLPRVFPNGIRMVPVGITAEGDRVAVEVESLGVLSDGFVYRNRYHFFFEVRDGRIALAREYCDTQGAVALLDHIAPALIETLEA